MMGKIKKIIYVGDYNYEFLSLRERLKFHFEFYPAKSLESLFGILLAITPSLILADATALGVEGYDMLRTLKSNVAYADIPLLQITEKGSGGYFDSSMTIARPFSDVLLINQINRVLRNDEDELSPVTDTKVREYKPQILAVDDVSIVLRTIKCALRDDYVMFSLTKPQEMKTFLHSATPDMFLLDCNMPEISGFDLVPIIRGFPEHKETPIIFITADGTTDKLVAAIGLGASDFIVKPIVPDVLYSKIAKLLKRPI